jgi:hypothetical protein
MGPIKRQRRRLGHPGKPTSQILAPNDVWSADYKGQFRTGDGRYCYPLTVADGFSRYLLGCQALPSTAVDASTVCIGEYVGLEEIADGIWNVYFGPLRLGRLRERHMRIEDEYGRLYRRHV